MMTWLPFYAFQLLMRRARNQIFNGSANVSCLMRAKEFKASLIAQPCIRTFLMLYHTLHTFIKSKAFCKIEYWKLGQKYESTSDGNGLKITLNTKFKMGPKWGEIGLKRAYNSLEMWPSCNSKRHENDTKVDSNNLNLTNVLSEMSVKRTFSVTCQTTCFTFPLLPIY